MFFTLSIWARSWVIVKFTWKSQGKVQQRQFLGTPLRATDHRPKADASRPCMYTAPGTSEAERRAAAHPPAARVVRQRLTHGTRPRALCTGARGAGLSRGRPLLNPAAAGCRSSYHGAGLCGAGGGGGEGGRPSRTAPNAGAAESQLVREREENYPEKKLANPDGGFRKFS
jgi:hypothetical protein